MSEPTFLAHSGHFWIFLSKTTVVSDKKLLKIDKVSSLKLVKNVRVPLYRYFVVKLLVFGTEPYYYRQFLEVEIVRDHL